MDSSESKSGQEVTPPESTGGEAFNLSKPWQDPSQLDEHEFQTSYTSEALLGIAFAGSAYPSIAASALLICSLFYTSIIDLPSALLILVIYSLIGAVFGFLIAGVVGGLAILLVVVVNRSLGYPLDARSAAISAGSLAGYTCTVWILFTPGAWGNLIEIAATTLLGPILAMTLGAIGAARASSKYGGLNFSVATRRRKQKISILHLMVATAWIAVALAIANSFGGLEFGFAVIGWFVLQGFMLGFIWLIRKLRRLG